MQHEPGMYYRLKPEEHVLESPEMWVDSVEPIERNAWILDYTLSPLTMVKKIISTPLGLERLIRELGSNAADNAIRTRDAGRHPGRIEIDVGKQHVRFLSQGLSIPITSSDSQGMDGHHVPETIFGHMFSGSSFVSTRKTGGRNGIGAKGVNIFSKEFTVTIYNRESLTKYVQKWRDNISIVTPPEITEVDEPESYIEITYVADFARFKCKGYTEDEVMLFAAYGAELSFTTKLPVFFNGKELECSSIMKYARMVTTIPSYPKGGTKPYVLHYQWPASTKVSTNSVTGEQEGYMSGKNGVTYKTPPSLEMIVIDAPNAGSSFSYVNSIATFNGGIHVNTALKAVTSGIMESFKGVKVTVVHIKPHTVSIVNINIENPVWGGGQTKTMLKGPVIKITIPESSLAGVPKWNLLARIKAGLSVNAIAKAAKGVKSEKFICSDRGIDAADAGDPAYSKLCTLSITEGESATNYEKEWISHDKYGRKRYGCLPIRGKITNALNKGVDKVLLNVEVREILLKLGAKPGVDYTVERNRKSLRYGRVRIMTDADIDGAHIKGLLVALFYALFPTLLEIGFVCDYMTPYLRMVKQKGKSQIARKFYNTSEYSIWLNTKESQGTWTSRYLKGLGTCTKEDIKDDYFDPHIVTMVYDSDAAARIELAMSKKYSAERREWMRNWDPDYPLPPIQGMKLNISSFIDDYFREYGLATLARHIPGIDGLSVVRRKITYVGLGKWRTVAGKGNTKLPVFTAKVSEKTSYHHGGDGMNDVAIGMCQNYVGANNIPMFEGVGSYGTRDEGGKDASASRYLHITGNPLINYIFKKEDDVNLDLLVIEGVYAEPKFLLPIFPLSLINGSNAIAMGWKSRIPNYHPLHITECIRELIVTNGVAELPELTPWYRGFTGEIAITVGGIAKDGGEKITMVSTGSLSECGTNSYTVVDLPIGMWNSQYRTWLSAHRVNGKISSYEDLCNATSVHFSVSGMAAVDTEGQPRQLEYSDMNITKKHNLKFAMLNEKGLPIKYSGTAEILREFYVFRLPYYTARKEALLVAYKAEANGYVTKLHYIKAIIDGKLVISSGNGTCRAEKDVASDVERLGLSAIYLKKVRDCDKSLEKVAQLEEKVAELERAILELTEVTAEQLWVEDLDEFNQQYLLTYGDDRPS